MQVTVEHPDGSRYSVFGVTDFQVSSPLVQLWPYPDTELPGEEKDHMEIEGEVVSAVDESSFNAQGVYETIGDLSVNENVSVIVAKTSRFPETAKAVSDLQSEDDFEGEITVTPPNSA